MAAREDGGSGRGGADPIAGTGAAGAANPGRGGADPIAGTGAAGAANPGRSPGIHAPTARAQTMLTAVLGSPAFPRPPHPHQYYTASPLGQNPAVPLHFPTPSPFPTSYSTTPVSSRWGNKSLVARYSNNALRALAIVLSFVTVALIPASATGRDRTLAGTNPDGRSSLLDYSAFSYLFGVGVIASVYSAAQLSKGIWEIAFKCNLVPSDKVADYVTFILDTVLAYLLLSSTSVAIFGLKFRDKSPIHDKVGTSAWSLAKCSIVTSVIAFLVVAVSAILSGYKLCKRLIW